MAIIIPLPGLDSSTHQDGAWSARQGLMMITIYHATIHAGQTTNFGLDLSIFFSTISKNFRHVCLGGYGVYDHGYIFLDVTPLILCMLVDIITDIDYNKLINQLKELIMRIELFVQGDSWVAYHPDNAEIFELFGSYIIPTAFTPAAAAAAVLSRIQELNPDCDVVLR